MLAKTPTAADALIEIRGLLSRMRTLRREGNSVDADKIFQKIERKVSEGIRHAKPEERGEPEVEGKTPRRKPATMSDAQRSHLVDGVGKGLAAIADGRRFDGKGHPFWDKVLKDFEEHRADFLYLAREVAMQIYRNRNPLDADGKPILKTPIGITVDDVRLLCPPPPAYDSRVMGAIFAGKKWVSIDKRPSERSACHYRDISVFVLA